MEVKKSQFVEKIFHTCVTWNIFNYFNGPVKVNSPVESPEFVTNFRQPIKWQLSLIARQEYQEMYVTECILKRSPSCTGTKNIVVKVRFSLINSQGSVWAEATRAVTLRPNALITFRTWDIYDTAKDFDESAIFYSGNITVKCEFLFDMTTYFKPSNVNADLRSLSNDLKCLYESGNFTDLDLKVDKETFPVHSAIVKARNPHIAGILNKDPGIREIDLTESCSIPVLKSLIMYWYSGNLENISKYISPLNSSCIRNLKQTELMPYVDPEVINMSTTFKTLNTTVNWVIEDLELCECLKHLERDLFYVYTIEDLPWRVYFYPKGIEGDSDFISLCIINQDCVSSYPTYIEVFLTDENGTEYGTKSLITWLNAPIMFEFPKFMPHDKFVNIRETVLKNDILRIGCRISCGTDYVKCHVETVSNSSVLALKKMHSYITLANAMKNLLQSGDMSDISLKAGGKLFKVHTPILAARSHYFNWFLSIKPSGTDVIKLEDIEPEDLAMLLKYLYCAERIELNAKLAVRLYPLFRKYKLTRLAKMCSTYLPTDNRAKTVSNTKEVPDLIKDLSLKGSAIRVILANLNRISKAEIWHTFGKIDGLASCILQEAQ